MGKRSNIGQMRRTSIRRTRLSRSKRPKRPKRPKRVNTRRRSKRVNTRRRSKRVNTRRRSRLLLGGSMRPQASITELKEIAEEKKRKEHDAWQTWLREQDTYFQSVSLSMSQWVNAKLASDPPPTPKNWELGTRLELTPYNMDAWARDSSSDEWGEWAVYNHPGPEWRNSEFRFTKLPFFTNADFRVEWNKVLRGLVINAPKRFKWKFNSRWSLWSRWDTPFRTTGNIREFPKNGQVIIKEGYLNLQKDKVVELSEEHLYATREEAIAYATLLCNAGMEELRVYARQLNDSEIPNLVASWKWTEDSSQLRAYSKAARCLLDAGYTYQAMYVDVDENRYVDMTNREHMLQRVKGQPHLCRRVVRTPPRLPNMDGGVKCQYNGKGDFSTTLHLVLDRGILIGSNADPLWAATVTACTVRPPSKTRDGEPHVLRLDLGIPATNNSRKFILSMNSKRELDAWTMTLNAYANLPPDTVPPEILSNNLSLHLIPRFDLVKSYGAFTRIPPMTPNLDDYTEDEDKVLPLMVALRHALQIVSDDILHGCPMFKQAMRHVNLTRYNIRDMMFYPQERSSPPPMDIRVISGDWGDVAQQIFFDTHHIPACLNMASIIAMGGAYFSGDATAQEEDMFRRTNCHFCDHELKDYTGELKDYTGYDATFLPKDKCTEDGGVGKYKDEYLKMISGDDDTCYLDMAPRICVLGSSPHNYPFLEGRSFLFYELRCAAVDLRRREIMATMGDNPQHILYKECEQLLEDSTPPDKVLLQLQQLAVSHNDRKILSQLRTLKEKRIRHVVLSAFGCGAFQNDPVAIATQYHKLLRDDEFRTAFDVVHFAIYTGNDKNDANFRTFEKILTPTATHATEATTAAATEATTEATPAATATPATEATTAATPEATTAATPAVPEATDAVLGE
jgi:hypothetical protein